MIPDPIGLVHQAGPIEPNGNQRCVRCGTPFVIPTAVYHPDSGIANHLVHFPEDALVYWGDDEEDADDDRVVTPEEQVALGLVFCSG